MIRLRHKLFIHALRGLDQAILYGTLLAVIDLVARGNSPAGQPIQQILREAYQPADSLGILLLIIGWIVVFNRLVSYQTNRFTTLKDDIFDVLKATSVSAFLLIVVSTAFEFGRVNNKVIVLFWAGATVLAMLSRIGARALLTTVRRQGYNYRHLLIVGHNAEALRMATRIEALPELGYKIVGFVAEPAGANPPPESKIAPVVGQLSEVQRILEQGSVDEMIICLPIREHISHVFDLVRLAEELGIVVRLFPDAAGSKFLERLHLEKFDGDHVITLFREQMLLQLLGKRVMDIVVSFTLLVLLSPLLIAFAVAIKFSSPGPIFFIQKRVGMNKRIFHLYKFRSMFIDAEKRRRELAHLNEMDGPVFKIKNDPRITPLGHFIRKTSIDELPQLLNVLIGEMSLVGPRPPIPEEVDRYDWLYRKRLSIKPGITCLWQISGRNHISFKQWMELDQTYIKNWSLWLDIKILVKTVPAVLFQRGAS
ncbi:MAG: hypothetical protein B9S34_15940 [Opitutia bacterium Tous-C1TDCM]|nr:MAG: hypothetical protein B9S34_15940 [Opitutae bacterium Tous-C1TDCM]